jgi:hypothetical protein
MPPSTIFNLNLNQSRDPCDNERDEHDVHNAHNVHNAHVLNNNNHNHTYQRPNYPLLVIDLLLLPIHIFRMVLIYFFGSKYNLKGFTFLDVLMHADKPYFNQEDCRLIDTMGIDYRVVIRDDSRIFPMDLNNYFKHSFYPSQSPSHDSNHNHIIVGDISDTSKFKYLGYIY